MHIALYEPNSEGHRYTHVRRLIPALAQLGTLTFVTSHEGVASPEYAAQIKPVEHLCTVESSMSFDKKAPIKHNLRSMTRHLRRAAHDLKADHVYMPYSDGTIQLAGFLRLSGRFPLPPNVELEGLMMRGAFAYSPSRGLRHALRTRAWLLATRASPFHTIHHMDPIVVRAIQARSPALARRVRLIPDPVEPFTPPTRQDARKALGIPDDGRLIGCVGYQDRRKGIDLLIRAFLAANLPPTDRLFLAGKQEAAIQSLLGGEAAQAVREGRIITLARYISDEELRLGVSALDVVCTPYPPNAGHSGSSSIVIHAAGQGRHSLGTDHGWVGDAITRFGLGSVCDVDNQPAFAAAIRASLEISHQFTLPEAGRRFVAFHRPDNFTACFTRRLRERLGLPQAEGLLDWEWVQAAHSTPSGRVSHSPRPQSPSRPAPR